MDSLKYKRLKRGKIMKKYKKVVAKVEETKKDIIKICEVLGVSDGFGYAVTLNDMGVRCGYINIPASVPTELIENINVHGGITYVGHSNEPIPGMDIKTDGNDTLWIGFDCMYYDDIPDYDSLDKYANDGLISASNDAKILKKIPCLKSNIAEIRTIEFCEYECKSVCEQVASFIEANKCTSPGESEMKDDNSESTMTINECNELLLDEELCEEINKYALMSTEDILSIGNNCNFNYVTLSTGVIYDMTEIQCIDTVKIESLREKRPIITAMRNSHIKGFDKLRNNIGNYDDADMRDIINMCIKSMSYAGFIVEYDMNISNKELAWSASIDTINLLSALIRILY